MKSPDFLREAARKAFHLLTLAYLGVYLTFERPLPWLAAWALVVVLFELARLRFGALNRALLAPFGGIMREEESRQVSGILHTTLGATLTVALFGGERQVVVGALLCLAFADAAAALAGKAFGRHPYRLAGKTKSYEGSVACWAVALCCLLAAGIAWPAALLGASVCALVEAAPLPINDNSVLPIAVAAALYRAG